MNCPTDNTTLLMSDRNGIEIDYCPQCRGVWLDRGELDKIIERSAAEAQAPAAPQQPASPQQPFQQQPPMPQAPYGQQPGYGDNRGYDQRGYDKHGYDNNGYGGKPRKQKHWLSELFD